MQSPTILFDINETVLNLSILQPKFKIAFGDETMMNTWFAMLLHSSTVCMMTQVKTDFATLAGITLDTLAARKKITLSPIIRQDILEGFAHLPAHSDIKPALEKLQAAGFHTVAFSNSSSALITQQIQNAGLSTSFNHILSVEETGSFKPDPQVYHFAAEQLQQPISSLRLVATHDWDTHGALCAGMQAAYIYRSQALYHPLYRQPDIDANNMMDIVEKIIEKHSL